MVAGLLHAKKFNKPCVMTIYNWRRKGIHPRLLAWRWAVSQSDRRWYISEFVWDSWEKNRKQGSARLPVVSRMPQGEISTDKRKGFLFIGRWVPNKGIRILLEAYARLKADPQEWPLTMLGDGTLREEVLYKIQQKGIKGVLLPGFVSESQRQRYTREAKWMVTPPHTQEDLGLTPWKHALWACLALLQLMEESRKRRVHMLSFVSQRHQLACEVHEKAIQMEETSTSSYPIWQKWILNNMFAPWMNMRRSISA